ncbi:MAG: hypothetical protein IJO57_00365 [Bacilli bacterium]|nr:hypothetical protein [Bacilli bacterium]
MNSDMLNSNKSKYRILIIYFILFFACLISEIYFLSSALYFQDAKTVSYSEKSNIDYVVYLKKNNFYEDDYLGKDMLYVASLIDKIKINFNYYYNIESPQNLDFYYNIVGKLVISDKTGKKVYFEKKYNLLSEKKVQLLSEENKNIAEEITIDYSYYNVLANDFKATYGVDTESKLIIYMNIDKKSIYSSFSPSVMSISIPLSKKSVEIALDYVELGNSDKLIVEKEKLKVNYIYVVLSSILIIASLILFIILKRRFALLIIRKNKCEKYVKKLLNEYDRLIVESSTSISFDNKQIISLKRFTELLDVHDNLQLPILYHVVVDGKIYYFYIIHNDIVYLHTVKSSDFEVLNEKEK